MRASRVEKSKYIQVLPMADVLEIHVHTTTPTTKSASSTTGTGTAVPVRRDALNRYVLVVRVPVDTGILLPVRCTGTLSTGIMPSHTGTTNVERPSKQETHDSLPYLQYSIHRTFKLLAYRYVLSRLLYSLYR